MAIEPPALRDMRHDDVPAVMAVQEPSSIAGLSDVFPQDEHPFPRDVLAERWHVEIDTPGIHCFVILRDGAVAGFAALEHDEVLHFGVALEEWGSGLAHQAHDELVEQMRADGIRQARLRVYAANARGRRFWEKLGWGPSGETTTGALPPYAELLTYVKPIDAGRSWPAASSPASSTTRPDAACP